MGRQRRDREVERLLVGRPAADEVLGLGRVDVGLVGRRIDDVRGRPVVDDRPVLVQRVPVHRVGAAGEVVGVVERAVPLAPARGHVGVVAGRPVAVQVLADVRGRIAGALQPDRQRVALRRHQLGVAAAGLLVGPDPVVVGVLAGQHRRPRGAAEREAREAVVEGDPGVGQLRIDYRHRLAATRPSGRRSSAARCWGASAPSWPSSSPRPHPGRERPTRRARPARRAAVNALRRRVPSACSLDTPQITIG